MHIPERITTRGNSASQMVAPNGRLKVFYHARVRYNREDSELFTTYDPATDLCLRVKNAFRQISLDFELHYDPQHNRINPISEGDMIVCRLTEGLLPYQGVRLLWKCEEEHGDKNAGTT
jgi:hypothetical protein